jgi:hypothetical protein
MIKLQVFWNDTAVSTGKHLPTFRNIVLMAVFVYQSTGHNSNLQQHHSKILKPEIWQTYFSLATSLYYSIFYPFLLPPLQKSFVRSKAGLLEKNSD